ncbi:type VI secretion system baseplate subunit TssG [Pedobacter sp. ISL-68]|uniref:type VI secretion system baseplate subunit TssG n=1 Tax=unclassified Pedobacter TaxID=2628915 RepID=UPI001BE99674|nr:MULTISPECIES: type VI secretion system baseplate subunit TssG [unclassified Pedobacter]MBT2563369.1 type VI secretion system baseplate subunit TssG [Pedobacter sp. ISL-64]MBT2588589.1 type VI secretion system baseplate subunit TssG [Pedobacter sp. ISL-68]
MKKETLINNELFTDYKAVAHAADLIERKVIDADRIEIIPLGPDKRAFAKDIEDTTAYYSEKRRHERIRISTNREGLYDMLPEGLFHRPPTGSAGMDEESMIKDIRDRREEEKEARLFFTPFDTEINYVRIMTELYENMLDKKTTYSDLSQIFEFGWDEFNLLNKEQSIIWMHLLPEIQQKRNDIGFVSKVLTALFNLPLTIVDATANIAPVKIAEEMQMQLGGSALGIDTIIGDSFTPEHEAYNVNIGPTSPQELVKFIPGQKNRAILDMAISYLIPVDAEVNVELLTSPDYQETVLSEDGESAYLGYTVYL